MNVPERIRLIKAVLFFSLIASLHTTTKATICSLSHPQTAICNSNFVARGVVLSISLERCKYDALNKRAYAASLSQPPSNSGSSNSYIATIKFIRVRLTKLYKGYLYINNTIGSEFDITFASPYSIPLWPGIEYLLTGFIVNKTPYMNSCSWFQVWAHSTVTQQLGIRRFYWIYCGCKVKTCGARNCNNSFRECAWKFHDFESAVKKMDCHSRHAVCMVKDGRCQWSNPKGKAICPSSDKHIP